MLSRYVPALKSKHKLTFPILLDPGNRLAATFGLAWTFPNELRQLYLGFGIDLPRYNGDDSWQLPLPARYLVDQKGVIRDAAVSVDYTDRPDIEATLAALKRLTG